MSPNRAIVALAAAASLVVAAPRTTRTAAPPPTYGPADDLVIPLERFHRAELVAGHTASPPPAPPAAPSAPRASAASRASRSSPPPTASAAASAPAGGALACLRRHESGGDYANRRNPTYRGAYQFDRQTWRSVGGHGDPADASPAEQDMRAAALASRRGWSPWPVTSRICGLR